MSTNADSEIQISNYESEVRSKSRALDKAKTLHKILKDASNWRASGNGFHLCTEANTVKEKKIEIPDECKLAILDLLEKYSRETIQNLLKT